MFRIRADIQLLIYTLLIHKLVIVNANINHFQLLYEGQSQLKWNRRLNNALIRQVKDVSILECVKNCVHTTRCQSFNYIRNFHVCELNYENGSLHDDSLSEEIGSFHGDKTHWRKEIFGLFCNQITCHLNEKCSENSTMGWCEISDCGFNYPQTNSACIVNGNGIGIGYHREYFCKHYAENNTNIICQNNGEWSGINLNCNVNRDVCKTDGYVYNETLDLCFKINNIHKNWTDARTACQAESADLIILNTVESFYLIHNLTNKFWLGASDIANEGEWRWVDGTIFNESTSSVPWEKVVLNNKGSTNSGGSINEADCLQLRGFNLQDNNCDVKQGFVCERKSIDNIRCV